MPSATCDGALPSGRRCCLGTNGGAVQLKGNGKCRRCHEKRCRSHCKCARLGRLHGRAQARPKHAGPRAVPKAKAAAAPAPVLPLAPAARPRAKPQVEFLPESEWMPRVIAAVRSASSLTIASLCVDYDGLCVAVSRRLATGAPVDILIDRKHYENRESPHQRPRLLDLQLNGANIFLCQGRKGRGVFHKKVVIIDGRVAFLGGANMSWSGAEYNGESVLRIEGPAVTDVQQDLDHYRLHAATVRGIS